MSLEQVRRLLLLKPLSAAAAPGSETRVMTSGPRNTSLRLILFWCAFITLDTATQIAFKVASESVEGMSFGLDFLKVAVSTPALWVTVLCYIGTFVTWMAVLMRMDLNRAFPLTALGYVTVPVLAFAFFGEHLPLPRIAGIGLIIVGVVMIGSDEGHCAAPGLSGCA